MDAVQRTQRENKRPQCLQSEPSYVFCYLLKKTLRSFWPFPSFYCKALAEVMTKWWNLGLCLNAYKKSSKITLQPFLR